MEILGGITVKNERGGRVRSGRGREREKMEVGKKEEDEVKKSATRNIQLILLSRTNKPALAFSG